MACLHTCGDCGTSYDNIKDFIKHRADYFVNEKYICCLCNKKFSRRNSLLQHVSRFHNVIIDENTKDADFEFAMSDADADVSVEYIEEDSQEVEVEPVSTNTPVPIDSLNNELKTVDFLRTKEELLDFVFQHVTVQVKHERFTYGKSIFQCIYCQYKTDMKLKMKKHMKEIHNDKLGLTDLDAIRVVFKIEDTADCQLMSYLQYEEKFGKNLRQLKKTKIVRNSRDKPGLFKCLTCRKMLFSYRGLQRHVKVHTCRNGKDFECDVCGKKFKNQPYLNRHKLYNHSDKIPFQCPQCDFTSDVPLLIQTHRQIHKDSSLICEICGCAYSGKATLKSHLKVHDPSRPYACDFPGCTWRFTNLNSCRGHQRGHTIEGQHKCKICNYGFRHKHHLIRHEERIHNITRPKPVKLLDQNAINIFYCDMCSLSFEKKCNLDLHVESFHKNQEKLIEMAFAVPPQNEGQVDLEYKLLSIGELPLELPQKYIIAQTEEGPAIAIDGNLSDLNYFTVSIEPETQIVQVDQNGDINQQVIVSNSLDTSNEVVLPADS